MATRGDQGSGAIVVVAGPEGRGKEVLVASARRRFGRHHAIAFPVRVMTRPPRDNCDYLSVSRRAFRDMEQAGSFALRWHAHGHEAAASADMLHVLGSGRLVVLVATAEAADRARALCRIVHLVEVLAGPDAARPRASAGGGRLASHHRLLHAGDMAEAVGRFNALIEALLAAAAPAAA